MKNRLFAVIVGVVLALAALFLLMNAVNYKPSSTGWQTKGGYDGDDGNPPNPPCGEGYGSSPCPPEPPQPQCNQGENGPECDDYPCCAKGEMCYDKKGKTLDDLKKAKDEGKICCPPGTSGKSDVCKLFPNTPIYYCALNCDKMNGERQCVDKCCKKNEKCETQCIGNFLGYVTVWGYCRKGKECLQEQRCPPDAEEGDEKDCCAKNQKCKKSTITTNDEKEYSFWYCSSDTCPPPDDNSKTEKCTGKGPSREYSICCKPGECRNQPVDKSRGGVPYCYNPSESSVKKLSLWKKILSAIRAR